MVMPNSEERTRKKISFTLLVFIPRESTGHEGHSKKPLGLPQNRRKEAIANIFLKEDKARQAYDFLS